MTGPWGGLGVLYQIYPRSFQDSNNDGIGDLRGIIRRLDYIKTVADAIWLSPIYQSPQKDFGYDVSSYTTIAPEYGTINDFDELIQKAHALGVRVFMDFVPSHTSDQHEWFKQSRKSTDNPKRDWYVWRDPKNGAEPNNWVSLAGGKSWEFDQQTGQYYLHSWLKSQPDLNWQNPAVRKAMSDMLQFWLERGVDGFRFDAVWAMAKDWRYGDEPLRPGSNPDTYGGYEHTKCRNGKQLNDYLAGLVQTVARYDAVVILEYYSTPEFGDPYRQLYSLQSIDPAHCSVFFFEPLHWPFTAQAIGGGIAAYLAGLPAGAVPVFCFGNHDQPRAATHFGGEAQARLIAALQLTLPGVPCVYNGEELGMMNGYIGADEGQDGFGSDGAMAGRDPERTPMQWDNTPGAGFSVAKPWLPVDQSYAVRNVAAQTEHPDSILHVYQALVQLRRNNTALRQGAFTLLGFDNNVLAYEVADQAGRFAVLINFNDTPHEVAVADGTVQCSSATATKYRGATGTVSLVPYEAIVIERTQ